MKVSRYVRIIENESGALAYHSLKGNLYFLEPTYFWVLIHFEDLNAAQKRRDDRIIRDLASAGFFVEDKIDERKFIAAKNAKWMRKVIGGGQLRLLNLMISEACNFGCRHCLHKCSVKTGISHGRKKIMDWATAQQAISSYTAVMQQNDCRHLSVQFGSAEPLLNWPVLKKSVEFISRLDSEAKLAVNTNLSLITRDMAKFLRDYGVYISTSLDGPGLGNDAIRTFSDGSGTFETIVAKFKILEEVGYPLDGFSITINDLNFEAVNTDFILWAKRQGFSGLATDIDLINVKNSQRSVSDCVRKLLELRDACQQLDMENFGSWSTAYDNLVNEPEDDMPTFCKAAKGRNISINPSGVVFICGHTNTSIGTLSGFDKIFQKGSDYYNLVESRLPGNDPGCKDCEIEGVCAGQCQITREVAKASKNTRDSFLCELYRGVTKSLLEKKLTAELSDS